MFALNEGDAIRGDASAATVVDYTLHGIIGTTIRQLADGQLANSEGNLYTATTDGIAVTAICLVNTDTSARTANLYLKPKGGTSRRVVPKNISLAAGYSMYANGVEIKIIDTSGQEQVATIALDDTPVDGQTLEGITSNWAYDHAAATTGTHGVTGTIVGTEDLDDVSWAEPARSLDQVYTNSTKIRIVSVSCYATSANSYYRFDAYCDNTDGATTIVGKSAGITDSGSAPISCITFVVPPSYKYQVITTADNETLSEWHEWDLF